MGNVMEEKQKHAGGRPEVYTKEIADEICLRLSQGESMLHICQTSPHLPVRSTINLWLLSDKHKEFSDNYAKAKAEYAEIVFDDLVNIADDNCEDIKTIIDKDGNEKEVVDNELVNRSRLRVDTRKWILARMFPKKYGEKSEIEHIGLPVPPSEITYRIVNPGDIK
jgi:hypothetical protein